MASCLRLAGLVGGHVLTDGAQGAPVPEGGVGLLSPQRPHPVDPAHAVVGAEAAVVGAPVAVLARVGREGAGLDPRGDRLEGGGEPVAAEVVGLDGDGAPVPGERLDQPPPRGDLGTRMGGPGRRLVDAQLEQAGCGRTAGCSLEVLLPAAGLVVDDPHPAVGVGVDPVDAPGEADRPARGEADRHGTAGALAEALLDVAGHPARLGAVGVVDVEGGEEAGLQLVDPQVGQHPTAEAAPPAQGVGSPVQLGPEEGAVIVVPGGGGRAAEAPAHHGRQHLVGQGPAITASDGEGVARDLRGGDAQQVAQQVAARTRGPVLEG